jgi:hypothetical protein
MAAEGEVMFCFQPAVVGAAEFCKRSEFDHWEYSFEIPGPSPGATRPVAEFRWAMDMPPVMVYK